MAKRVVTTDRLMKPIAHFSHGARVGERIHIGAEAGTDAQQRLAGRTSGIPDMAAQAERLFDNFEIALGALGGALRDVVRFRAWINDWRDAAAYEAAFRRRFGARPPASVTLGSHGFPLPHATVEAELIAVVGGDSGAHFYCTVAGADAGAALKALHAELEAARLAPRDAVLLDVSLADIRDVAAFEDACARYFPARRPACTLVGTSLARVGERVVIECTAVRGGGEPLPGNAVLAGDELYIGGQPGRGQGAEAQTRAAWERVHALLALAGMTRDDVVRTCNVLTDWRHYGAYNAGYGAFVVPPYPPRATLFGALGDAGAQVQIEALAHRAGRDALTLEANPPA